MAVPDADAIARSTRCWSGSEKAEACFHGPPGSTAKTPIRLTFPGCRFGAIPRHSGTPRALRFGARALDAHPQGPSGGKHMRYSVALLAVVCLFNLVAGSGIAAQQAQPVSTTPAIS